MLSTRHIRVDCVLILAGLCLAACASSDTESDGSTDPSDAGEAGADANSAAAGHSGASGAGGAGNAGKAGSAGQSGASGAGAGGAGNAGKAGSAGHSGQSSDAGSAGKAGSSGSAGMYSGPTVGTAKRFAVLAYDSVTTANISTVTGSIGVSAAAVSVITGFDAIGVMKYGNDSLAPNADLTRLAQLDVTTLVGNIEPRPCDRDLTDVVGGLTGDVTLQPGVTCMNSFSADVVIDGHVYLDAAGDPNAFFIIRGNKTLTVSDGAQIVLMNDARNCGVFWRISAAVTIGKTVAFHGTLISGSAITMKSASTLNGRAFAQTEGIQLDANTITAPTDGDCPHVQ